MAEIELVIKIDEDYYKIIKHGVEDGSEYKPWTLIAHGTPLKTGYWIRWYEKISYENSTEYNPHCKCSECNTEYDPHTSQFIKYCNVCGAKMESEDT